MNELNAALVVCTVLKTIINFIKGENWKEALRACVFLINAGTATPQVYFYAGLCSWRLGERHMAVKLFFKQALKMDPNVEGASFAHNCIGLEYRRRGSEGGINKTLLARAVGHFQAAIALNRSGSNGTYLYLIASCLAAMGGRASLQEAINCYEAALKEGYKPEKVLFDKGLCLQALGQLAAAIETFRQLLQLNPEHGKATLALANCLMVLGYDPADTTSTMMATAQSPAPELAAQRCCRRFYSSVAAALEKAAPFLKREAQATKSDDTTRIYAISADKPAVLRDDDRLEHAWKSVSNAYGLAAICHARCEDWTSTERCIQASLCYDRNNHAARHALGIYENETLAGVRFSRRIEDQYTSMYKLDSDSANELDGEQFTCGEVQENPALEAVGA